MSFTPWFDRFANEECTSNNLITMCAYEAYTQTFDGIFQFDSTQQGVLSSCHFMNRLDSKKKTPMIS